jgi:hypothetical protein
MGIAAQTATFFELRAKQAGAIYCCGAAYPFWAGELAAASSGSMLA